MEEEEEETGRRGGRRREREEGEGEEGTYAAGLVLDLQGQGEVIILGSSWNVAVATAVSNTELAPSLPPSLPLSLSLVKFLVPLQLTSVCTLLYSLKCCFLTLTLTPVM